MTEIDQIRQILAADMTTQPASAPLPAPREALGDVARCVYDLVQETRQLRPKPAPAEPPPGICGLCNQPMPPGEEMFKYHGYSGPCPPAAVPTEKQP